MVKTGVKAARGFALFMNWFDALGAGVAGLLMMAGSFLALPAGLGSFIPLSVFDRFPFHDVFFLSLFWPGLALFTVNALPNIIALAMRRRGDIASSFRWGVFAGVLLIAWTCVEMVYIPNGLSLLYLLLGVLQVVSSSLAAKAFA